MKLLKTIRFDASDARVYELAAAPEEWAVSGAFAFAGLAPEAVVGKARQAFANGFLGVSSFGRSTFATVAEATPADLEGIEGALAHHFVAEHGAPGLEAALPAAKEEARFVLDLCRDAPINTVFTVRRTRDALGRIKEEFRTIRPPTGEPLHAKIWTVVDDEP
jgi:Family of unknown function (DUF6505)